MLDTTTNEGPQPLPIRYTCEGCRHLKTEWWRDYLENDETDSGTSAKCLKIGKTISVYWTVRQGPPDWCPFTENKTQ